MSLRNLFPWLEDAAYIWEPAATMASSSAAEIPAGLYGLAELARTGDPALASQASEGVLSRYTYEPRTITGQQGLADVGGALSSAVEATGLDDLIAEYQTASGRLLPPAASALLEGVLMAIPPAPARAGRSTIRGAQRKAFPGIYDEPAELVKRAEAQVAPESENLGRLFGVTREDLRDIAQRPGTQPGVLPGAAPNPQGSRAASLVMKPANTQRLVDALSEARGSELLAPGMEGWYVMDPVYQRLLELTGDPAEAARRYDRLNTLSAMSSPNATVISELNRGTAANYLLEQDRWEDFVKYGGLPAGTKQSVAPEDMRSVLGHLAHKTAHVLPMEAYLREGSVQMKSPKVPLYMQSSGVPATGFQTELPVGDAHWSRGIGLADTRTGKNWGASFTNPEAAALGPWWRDEVAGRVGLESVPGQALLWGLMSPQTGVKSAIGAPKLEILSDEIAKAARRLNVSPEEARDMILMGRAYTGK